MGQDVASPREKLLNRLIHPKRSEVGFIVVDLKGSWESVSEARREKREGCTYHEWERSRQETTRASGDRRRLANLPLWDPSDRFMVHREEIGGGSSRHCEEECR